MTFFSKSGLTCRKISKMTWEYLTNTYLGICDPIKVVWKRFYTILKNRFWLSPALPAPSRGVLRAPEPEYVPFRPPKWLYLGEFLADLDETGVRYH